MSRAPGRPTAAGVAGWPVAHSLSPTMMNAWLEAAGIPARYAAFEVSPDQFEQTARALPGLGVRGINVTLPHKEAALALADAASETARRIGAANVLLTTAEGGLFADNTDVAGVRAALGEGGDAGAGPAVLIGAGGAARAALAVLAGTDREIRIVNRTPARARTLADAFGVDAVIYESAGAEALADAALIINATSLGMTGQPALEIALDAAAPDALVFDMVYDPLETPLLAAARASGRRAVDGLAMLIGQARPSFEAFFGAAPPDIDIRARLVEELEARR
jgi:shikimate dehydrogenase